MQIEPDPYLHALKWEADTSKLLFVSLRLEHEECLVLLLKQVEEEHPFCLVSDC